MLNVGFSEILFVFVLVLLVVGPDKLPAILRRAGTWYRKARLTVEELRGAFMQELDRADPESAAQIEKLVPRGSDIFPPILPEGSRPWRPTGDRPLSVEEQVGVEADPATWKSSPAAVVPDGQPGDAAVVADGQAGDATVLPDGQPGDAATGEPRSVQAEEGASEGLQGETRSTRPVSLAPEAFPSRANGPAPDQPPLPAKPRSRQDAHEIESTRMPLLAHLRELRKRIFVSLIWIVIGVSVTTTFAPTIWKWLVAPMNEALAAQGHGNITVTTPLEGVTTYLKVGVYSGLFLASPFVFHQIWAFVAPGLYRKEKRWVLPLVASSTLLFASGAAFGYFVIFRYAFPFFLSVTEGTAESLVSMQAYLSTASKLLLSFGLCFQLPVVIFFAARLGLVNAWDLVRWYRYAIVVIFILAAVLTPPDVMSQILMAIPLMVLYGVGILVAVFTSTKKRKAKA
jgi:sec-independent protein translocase protein TatC